MSWYTAEDEFEIELSDGEEVKDDDVRHEETPNTKKRKNAADPTHTVIKKLVNKAMGQPRVPFKLGKRMDSGGVVVHLEGKYSRFCSIQNKHHTNVAASLIVDVEAGSVRQTCFKCKQTNVLLKSSQKKKQKKSTKKGNDATTIAAGKIMLDLVEKHRLKVESLRKARLPNEWDPSMWVELVDMYSVLYDDDTEYNEAALLKVFEDAVTLDLNIFFQMVTGGSRIEILEQQCERAKNDDDVWENRNLFLSKLPVQVEIMMGAYVKTMPGPKQKQETPMTIWLRNSKQAKVKRIVFDPSPDIEISPHVFNLFRGLAVTKEQAAASIPDGANVEDLIKPFLDHVTYIWYRGNLPAAQFMLRWMASLVQRPWIKMKIMPALFGGQGAGKGLIIQILKSILGCEHFHHCINVDSLLGKFHPEGLKTALLIFLDECTFSGDKQQASLLKGEISEKTRRFELKFQNAVTLRNYANMIAVSNLHTMVSIEHDDRRTFISELDSRFSGGQTAVSEKYFAAILALKKEHVAHYLYNVDLSTFNPAAPPSTPYLRFQKKNGFNSTIDWIETQLRELDTSLLYDHDGRAKLLRKNVVYDQYRSEYATQQYRKPQNASTFWKTINTVVPNIQATRSGGAVRQRQIQLPALSNARKAFISYVRETHWDWDDENATQNMSIC
jgi:hypothetical protein